MPKDSNPSFQAPEEERAAASSPAEDPKPLPDYSVFDPEEAPPAEPPRRQRRKHQKSVIEYIAVLFIAAFILLAVTFIMERRNSAQAINNLKESVSAMQTVDDLHAENTTLEKQVNDLKKENASLKDGAEVQSRSLQAMDWFWQIDEAYTRGRYSQCRTLIQKMEDAGLISALPAESVTDTDRSSPAERLAEIQDKVS